EITVTELPAEVDVEAAKQALWQGGAPGDGDSAAARLALVEIAPDAVERVAGSDNFGAYTLYLRSKQDDRVTREIRSTIESAIIDARSAAAGLEAENVFALTRMTGAQAREVTQTGERASNLVLNMLLPFAYMILLLMSSMMGGQFLMTTVVEEKSSRVIEV